MRPSLTIVAVATALAPPVTTAAQEAASEAAIRGASLPQVFERRGGEWWIDAFHNVDVTPAPAP
jgi:hypothetical protein